MRSLVPAIALGAAVLIRPAAAEAQFIDIGAVGQRAVIIAQQLTQIGHQLTTITTLRQQFGQLEDQLDHMEEAALGQVGQLTDAFSSLSAANAQTLLDSGLGSWRNRLSGTGGALAAALASMDGSSLSDFLVAELAAADAVGAADLRALYPNNDTLSTRMADAWTAARERGDRIRAGDLATAEAAGRVTALLRAAQGDIDGRRAQADLSHTALQQAQVANQLTAAELQISLAQLQALDLQREALSRHEVELLHREELERWVARERAAQARAAALRSALDGRRQAWLDAMRLVRP